MKFEYLTRLGPHGWEYEPKIEVVFINPKNGKSVEVLCLIDSGAGATILNAEFAEVLGIDLTSGKPHPYMGISEKAPAYDHPVEMRLKQDTHTYRIICSFMPGLTTTGLLGQRGFFEHYKVTFELSKKRFEIVPIPLVKI